MKRWVLLAAAVVALAAAATVAVNYLPEAVDASGAGPKYPVATAAKADLPGAVVEGDRTFNFGTLPQQVTGKHAWVVKNDGKATLELWMISSTCSCTLAKFKDGEKAYVKPGESTEITLEYETRTNTGDYEKGAEIGTNDPSLPQFPLHVKGKVYPALLTVPALDGGVLNLLSISNDVDDHVTTLGLYSKDRPETKVLKATSSKPEAIEVTWEPMTAEDLKTLELEGGAKLKVNVKSGLPLGTFREEVVVTTDHPKQPELKFTVAGQMQGPVNFLPGSLRMRYPPVNGKTGGSGEIVISVRENRETKFEVARTPKGITAAVLPTNPARKGRYRLVVTVPPGTPAQDVEDDIELQTDHPKAHRVFVPVSILVSDSAS